MTDATFDLIAHLERQRAFSLETFGPGRRTEGVSNHIRKELAEIAKAPDDLEEWIDVVLLALDGAWRSGASPLAIAEMLAHKQIKNERRQWPDWRTAPANGPIEHVKAPAPRRCPRCDAPAPHLHPAIQHEGEVQECAHPWHGASA